MGKERSFGKITRRTKNHAGRRTKEKRRIRKRAIRKRRAA